MSALALNTAFDDKIQQHENLLRELERTLQGIHMYLQTLRAAAQHREGIHTRNDWSLVMRKLRTIEKRYFALLRRRDTVLGQLHEFYHRRDCFC